MRLSTRRGADHPLAKFSAEEAAAICKRFIHDSPRPSIRALARELHVSPETVSKLLHRVSYRE